MDTTGWDIDRKRAYADKLQRAMAIQGAQDSGGPDRPFSEKVVDAGVGTMGALGKAAGALRALTTGPITGSILEGISGKKVYSGSDMAQAINPTNLKTFPSNFEMMKKAGLPNPALSDVLPGLYADKGKGGSFQPEKGGMLDPTVMGALQVPTDPAMWLGAGEGGAAAEVLAANAAKNASLPIKALSMAYKPVEAVSNAIGMGSGAKLIAKGVEALPGGQYAETLMNPISAAARAFGKTVYGAGLRPVEHEGETYGKTAVVDRMQQAGVIGPWGIEKKAASAAQALGSEAQARMAQSALKGGIVDMDAALSPGYAEVSRLRGLGSESANSIADSIESELNSIKTRAKGVPGTPGIPAREAVPPGPPSEMTVESPILDQTGRPMEKTVDVPGSPPIPAQPAVPGTPGVAPKPYTPQAASDLKSYLTGTLPQGTFKPALATPAGARGIRNAASGIRQGVEDTLESTLGEGQGAQFHDINDALGTMLATKKSQARVGQIADRKLDNLSRTTGMDAVVTGLGGLPALAVKKGMQAAEYGSMPAGLALQKLGETNYLDRLNEMVNQQKRKSQWQK